MAELTGWPTDGAEGSVSSEARWRVMAKLWAPSGVTTPGGFTPTLVAGPAIDVAAGAAWVDGHYCESLSTQSIPSTANGLLVVRFTPADNLFELVWRDGATTPTQGDAVWELPIAKVTAGALTDVRALVNRGIRHVATVAELPSTGVNDGEVAWVAATPGGLYIRRSARWWTRQTGFLSKTTDASGEVTITAAEIGFVEFTYGHAYANYTTGVTSVGWSTSRVGTNTSIVGRIFRLNAAAPATVLPAPAGVTATWRWDAEGYVT